MVVPAMTLAWPWVLLLLPLPLLVRWMLTPAQTVGGQALRLPARIPLTDFTAAESRGGRRLRLLFGLAIWGMLVMAAARPQWLGEPAALPVPGRDLMLAVDVSGSMDQPDFELAGRPASRLGVVKEVARTFIERRTQDRLGLILFASQPYVQAPLTFDRRAVAELLEEAVVGIAGRDTAIGDAIGLAVKRLREQPRDNRVLILLTDGDNTVGRLSPLQAADLADRAGIRIYTIGLGGLGGLGGRPGSAAVAGYQVRRAGDDLNPALLRAIAERTRGRYFNAADAAELRGVYRALNRLEPNVRGLETYRPATELYPYPAATALGLSVFLTLLVLFGSRLRPPATEPRDQPAPAGTEDTNGS
jgi:Ca-activated chloride channel family protein